MEELGKAVFRRRVVVGINHRADEEEHEPPRRHGNGHEEHAIDEDEVGSWQGESPPQESDTNVDENDDDKKADCTLRGGIEPHAKVLEYQAKWGEQTNCGAQSRADEEALQRKR